MNSKTQTRNSRTIAKTDRTSKKLRMKFEDPDPFGSSKLFSPSGRPLVSDGMKKIPVAGKFVALPPRISAEESVYTQTPDSRSNKSRSSYDGNKFALTPVTDE
jgi:hypothetical protein